MSKTKSARGWLSKTIVARSASPRRSRSCSAQLLLWDVQIAPAKWEAKERSFASLAKTVCGQHTQPESDPEPGPDGVGPATPAGNVALSAFRSEVRGSEGVVTLAEFFWADARNVAVNYNVDPFDLLCDAVDFVARREGKPRLGPKDWVRWVAGTPGGRALQGAAEAKGVCPETEQRNGADRVRVAGTPCEYAKTGDLVADRERRRRSVRQQTDYNATVDRIIYSLCEEMEEYAKLYELESVDLLKDVFQLMAVDTPILTRPDREYAEGVTAVRDWFLADLEAVACSYDLVFLDVLEDVFYIIIADEVLPRVQAEKVATCPNNFGVEMRGLLPPA